MSGVFLMVRKSLRQHLLSTAVTALCVALAGGLVMAIFAINRQAREAFAGGSGAFDAVLGAKGSKQQLVLNSVFHLETSPGNIPWSLYERVRKDPGVALAVPYALGDNFKGFRIVGTTADLFTRAEMAPGRKMDLRGGRLFEGNRREAVIGSFVAEQTGLRVGSHIHPTHGLHDAEQAHVHDEEYVVVGVLKPTNSPNDRVIWIPIEGAFRMEGHVLRGTGKEYHARPGETIPEESKEVSAVMLKFKGFQQGRLLERKLGQWGADATLAFPIGGIMGELFDKLGWVYKVLALVGYLVVFVAAASVMATIYNTVSERRREFAILRALGARRGTLFAAIVAETAVVSAIGAAAGFVVYFVIFGGTARMVLATTGVHLDVWSYSDALWMTPVGLVALGALAGVWPAVAAYRTPVAENIAPTT